ncbi:MAG: TVP38/TMEM64 family protein [Planctomycetota bacterium]
MTHQRPTETVPEPPSNEPPSQSGWKAWKILLAVFVACVVVFGLTQFSDSGALASFADREAELRRLQEEQPFLIDGAAFVLYVSVTGLSLPGAAALSLAFGWFFGFFHGLVLISFASTLGATIAFLSSRYLLRDLVTAKFGERLKSVEQAFAREGAYYLFSLRLIPAIPFFVINTVMGLTPIRVVTFWWVSQLGMLPGTIVYVYAGSRAPSIATLSERGVKGILSWELLVAFTLLGTFPLILRRLVTPRLANQTPADS